MAKRRRKKNGLSGPTEKELEEAANGRIERAIRFAFPRWAAGRNQWRRHEQIVNAFASYRHSEYTRLTRARGGKSGSADSHLDKIERLDLVERCRDLERNNAIAKGMLDRSTDNVVSTGLTPQARTGNKKLNEAQEEAFKEWAESDADIRGQMSFWQMTRVAHRTRKRDGDLGFILTNGHLQPIECDRIVTPHDLRGDAKVTQGIEMDGTGKPVAYWVAPYATYGGMVNEKDATRVPARNFIHIYHPERFSQSRGCPAMAPCLAYFEQLDQYIEYELATAGTSSMVGGVITGEERAEPFSAFASNEENAEGDEQKVFELEPGAILNLSGIAKGKFSSVTPSHPATQFSEFVCEIMRIVGLPMGLPLELVSLDFKKGSYGSSRLAILQAIITFRCDQGVLRDHACRRIWTWKQWAFAASGKVKVPKGVKDGRQYQHIWQMPTWPWIDPLDEAKAHALALDRGMETLQEIAQEKGMDATELMDARADEIAYALKKAEVKGILDSAGKPDWRAVIRADTRERTLRQGSGQAAAGQTVKGA